MRPCGPCLSLTSIICDRTGHASSARRTSVGVATGLRTPRPAIDRTVRQPRSSSRFRRAMLAAQKARQLATPKHAPVSEHKPFYFFRREEEKKRRRRAEAKPVESERMIRRISPLRRAPRALAIIGSLPQRKVTLFSFVEVFSDWAACELCFAPPRVQTSNQKVRTSPL